MQFPRIAAGALAATIVAATAQARPDPPARIHEVTAQEVVYAVPGMDRVVVKSDVPYKKIEGGELKLDLYSPPDAKPGAKYPAVVFINGVGDRPGPPPPRPSDTWWDRRRWCARRGDT